MIRTRPNYDTPHGATDATLPRPTAPNAPASLIAIQKHIKRRTGELVPMATLIGLRNGGEPCLATPQIAIDAIKALPPVVTKRRRMPAPLVAEMTP